MSTYNTDNPNLFSLLHPLQNPTGRNLSAFFDTLSSKVTDKHMKFNNVLKEISPALKPFIISAAYAYSKKKSPEVIDLTDTAMRSPLNDDEHFIAKMQNIALYTCEHSAMDLTDDQNHKLIDITIAAAQNNKRLVIENLHVASDSMDGCRTSSKESLRGVASHMIDVAIALYRPQEAKKLLTIAGLSLSDPERYQKLSSVLNNGFPPFGVEGVEDLTQALAASAKEILATAHGKDSSVWSALNKVAPEDPDEEWN